MENTKWSVKIQHLGKRAAYSNAICLPSLTPQFDRPTRGTFFGDNPGIWGVVVGQIIALGYCIEALRPAIILVRGL